MGDHQAGVDTGILGEERRQAVRAGAVEHAIGAPLGDGSDLGGSDRQEVARKADGCAVEVAARLDATVGQHAGVVDRRHQLGVGNRAGVGDGVARRAVHLRSAAQRVRILHARIVGAVTGNDRAVDEQPSQVGGRHRLAVMRTQCHEVGGERPVGRHQRLDAHRRGDVGGSHQHVEVGECEHQHAEHAVGAVDQRQALLGAQRDRGDAGGGHGLGAFTLADQRQRDVCQRCEIATGAQRPVLVNGWDDVGVEQRQDRVDHFLTHSREPHRQRARPQQHHRPHDFWFDQRTHACRMRSDEGALQLLASLGWDHRRGERAEPGRDAVDRVGEIGETLDDRGTAGDRVERRFGQCDPGTASGHGDDVGGS